MTNDKLPESPRLLPCPLFGHLPDKGEFTAGPYIAVSGAPDMPKFYAVVCPGCCSTAYDENKERVIKKWNTRADLAGAVAASLESICKAVEDALNSYRMRHTLEAPDLEHGLSLVDRLTPDDDTDVTRGREELDALIDHVCGSVGDTFRRAPAPSSVATPMPNQFRIDDWPLSDVLIRLADAVDHLLRDHNCDMHGHEGISFASFAARYYAKQSTLSAAIAAAREIAASVNQTDIHWARLHVTTDPDYEGGQKAIQKIAAIITRHVTPSVPSAAWLPIETAPRDGSPVLIANDRTVHEVRWMISVDKGAPEGGWFVGGYNGWRLTWKPNKWMPLPSLVAVSEWRLVETAPKYETILLGAQGLEGWIQMSGYRTNEDWYFIGGGWMGVEPTHWMPLPNPPGSPVR